MSRKKIYLLIIPILFFIIISANDSKEQPISDSISGATIIDRELELEEVIIQKIEEIQPEVIISDKKYIEVFDDTTSDFKRYDSSKRYSNMILFKENQESEIPSLSEEFEENLDEIQKPWYKLDSFIPEDINDFYKALPKYNYKINIIQPGKNKISESLGEQIFFIAYRYFRSNNIKNSKLLFEKLINYNHRIPDSYYYLSWCSYLNKDYVTSIDYMNEAVLQGEKEKLPGEVISDYHYQIANFYLKLKDYSSSIVYYFKSLDYNPENVKCYNKLGISYYDIGNPQKALDMWEKGMKRGNKESESNYKWLYNKLNN